MIYSDGVHIVSDVSLDDLHKYCESILIKRCWYHASSKHKHYDIPKRRRESFFKDHPEVRQVSAREIVDVCVKLEAPTGIDPVSSD